MEKRIFKCCICGVMLDSIHDMHNARPYLPGSCCLTCNVETVLPYRMKVAQELRGGK